jgi:hypothetical protein
MPRTVLIAALLLASPLYAQYSGPTYATIYTPEVHIGSATQPSTITVPPVLYVTSAPSEPQVSNATPADTELLAQRHFDFIVSPTAGVEYWPYGSLADTSVSLGEYARQLRSQKHKAAMPSAPNNLSQPTNSR